MVKPQQQIQSVLVRHNQTSLPICFLVVNQFVEKNVPKEQKKYPVKLVPKKDIASVEASFIPTGDVLKGEHALAKYFARLYPELNLYDSDSLIQTQIDEWIDLSIGKLGDDHLQTLEKILLSSDYIFSHVTLADIALWAYFQKNSETLKNFPSLSKWFNSLGERPEFSEIVKKKTEAKPTAEKKKINLGSQGAMDLNLHFIEGNKVCTRFPPEPSGYLHIGHIKAALLNNYYARKYNGKLLLRFDDTNPSKEKDTFVENIIQDLNTAEIKPDSISSTSDHFATILDYAKKLIEMGKGYMDATEKEQLKAERMNGIESAYRNTSIQENLRLWQEFVNGSEEGRKYFLRGKIDMSSLNKAMRDPVFYRTNDTPHHKTGTKFKVYPMYDFACPIVDSIEGVTHALRSSEYHDRIPLYDWVLNTLNLRKVFIEDFSRLNFKYTVLSKRKLQWFVDKGYVSGWDDPAFPTVQGIFRRGLTLEALKEFILSQGASKVVSNMEMEKLWVINKKLIDPIIPRFTALPFDRLCPLFLENGPTTVEYKTVPKHKKEPSLGEKVLAYCQQIYLDSQDANAIRPNEEVTLMDWGNAIITEIKKDEQTGKVVGLSAKLHLEGDFKATEKKLTWLPQTDELIKIDIHEYGNLVTKDKLEENEKLEDFVNPHIHQQYCALSDPNLKSLKKGDRLQLERTGYFIVDQTIEQSKNSQIQLIAIPEGKSQQPSAADSQTSKQSNNKNKNNNNKKTSKK